MWRLAALAAVGVYNVLAGAYLVANQRAPARPWLFLTAATAAHFALQKKRH